MAGFTGNPRIWSRLSFLTASTSVREDHAVYSWVFSNSYQSNGSPMASMAIRPDHKRFAYATAQWTIYTGPIVRSRQFHINPGIEGDSITSPALWNTGGISQATASLTVPNTATDASPQWDMTDTTTPATGAHSAAPGWTGDYSADGTVFASILYHATDPTKIYLSVKQNGTALVTRQLLGITHYRQLGGGGGEWKVDIKVVILSTTNIWLFHINESSAGSGEPRLFLSVWNGSTISSTTLVDVGAYSMMGFDVIRGTAGLSYLVYSVHDLANSYAFTGPVNGRALVRSINESTRAVSAVLNTSPVLTRQIPGDTADLYTRSTNFRPGDRIPSNRAFAYKGKNYLVHVFSGQAVVVYTYTDAAPSTITLLRWGFIEKYEKTYSGVVRQQYISDQDTYGRVTGIEYDPVSDTAFLVHMIPMASDSLSWVLDGAVDMSRQYITRHWQALDDATWNQKVEILDELPSYVFGPGTENTRHYQQDILGYVPSRYGTATEGLLYVQSRRADFGSSIVPNTLVVRIQNWHDPIDIQAEVSVELAPEISITGARTYDTPISVSVTPAITVSGVRNRFTQWATEWTHEVDLFVDGAVDIQLALQVTITGNLATTHQGEVEIDFKDSLNISVTGQVERIFLFEHCHVSIGVTFLQDFHDYMNAHRAEVWGLPPVKIMGLDARSMAVLSVIDIAQEHSDNMAETRWYAHGAAALPLGWRTADERLRKVSDIGAENIQHMYSYYIAGGELPSAYEIWLAWRYSPPHYANMMMDWDALIGPGSAPYVYSSLALTFGPFPTHNGGGPPWDTYPIVPYDDELINDPFLNTVYSTNNFVFIKEAYVEATLIERWQRDEMHALLLDYQWQRAGLYRLLVAHSSPYSMPLGTAHVAMYGGSVTTTHLSINTHSVVAQHESVNSQSMALGPVAHEGSYDLQKLILVSALEAVWNDRISVEFDAQYDDVAKVRASLETPYDDVAKVRASLETPYEDVVRAYASHESTYSDYARIAAALTSPYDTPRGVQSSHTSSYAIQAYARASHVASAPLGPQVAAAHAMDYVLEIRNPIAVGMLSAYEMLGEMTAQFSEPRTLVTLNGNTIEIDDGYISADYDSPGYTFSCKVADINFVFGAKQGDPLDVVFEGTPYTFFLSDISRDASEGSAGDEVTISGLSPIMLLDAPYAETITYAPETAKTFSEIIGEVLGVPVDFSRHIDWLVPYGRAQTSQQTPLSAARSFLEAVGSRLLSRPDGSVYVLQRYPVGFDALPSGVPPHAFEEKVNMFTRSSSYNYAKGYNRYRVRDSDSSFADQIEFDDKENIATVYISPYRDSWRLECTTTPDIYWDAQGESIEEYTELWDFSAGTASAKYPILDLVSVSWITDSLGGLSFEPSSTRVSAPTTVHFGYGVAKVTYRAKCHKFLLITNAQITATQLLIVEQ